MSDADPPRPRLPPAPPKDGTPPHSAPPDLGGKACCGPDVTNKLVGVLKTVIEDYRNLNGFAQLAQWAGIGFWDINPLRQGLAAIVPAGCGRPAGSFCADTVTVFGRCFLAGLVNYTIYGVIEVLCGARLTGGFLHTVYWTGKFVTGKTSVRMGDAEIYMIGVGRAYAEGGWRAMRAEVQRAPGRACVPCALPAKQYQWRYTWAPMFWDQPARY